jgi:glycine/D-amino acid oxidase-like deaminating enzyme
MATTPGYVKRIRHDIDLAHELGIQGIEWLDRDAARAKVDSELYLGAWWEPRLGLINPGQAGARGEAAGRGARRAGLRTDARRRNPARREVQLRTPCGTVTAEKWCWPPTPTRI